MIKNQTIWHPLQDEYVRDDMPEGYDYYALLDGDNGPMNGNFYEDRDRLGRFVVKVCTPAGLIDAKHLGCRALTLVEWPEQQPLPAYDAERIEEIVSDILDDPEYWEDGQLISMRRSYETMAQTRRSGQPIEHLGEPMRSYPAEVWERCAYYTQQAIEARTGTVNKAEVVTNPFRGMLAMIDEAIVSHDA